MAKRWSLFISANNLWVSVHALAGSVTACSQLEAQMQFANQTGRQHLSLRNVFMTRYVAACADEIAEFFQALAVGVFMPKTVRGGSKAIELLKTLKVKPCGQKREVTWDITRKMIAGSMISKR